MTCLWKSLFRASKVFKVWDNSTLFRRAGLPFIPPVISVEHRRFGLLGNSYSVFGEAVDCGTLLDVWPELSVEAQTGVLTLVATQIGSMHEKGLVHGDLNWRNILVSRDSRAETVYFIDLDDARQFFFNKKLCLSRDLKHFLRDMQRMNVSDSQFDLFFETWRGQIGQSLNAAALAVKNEYQGG